MDGRVALVLPRSLVRPCPSYTLQIDCDVLANVGCVLLHGGARLGPVGAPFGIEHLSWWCHVWLAVFLIRCSLGEVHLVQRLAHLRCLPDRGVLVPIQKAQPGDLSIRTLLRREPQPATAVRRGAITRRAKRAKSLHKLNVSRLVGTWYGEWPEEQLLKHGRCLRASILRRHGESFEKRHAKL